MRPRGHSEHTIPFGPRGGPFVRRYGAAVALAAISLLAAVAVIPLTSTALYAPLLVGAAVSVWYGGAGPGLVTVLIAWTLALWLEDPALVVDATEQGWLRWIVNVAAALAIVLVSFVLRRGHVRAASAAVSAIASGEQTRALQRLAAVCAGAVTRAEIARALVDEASQLLGADGASVGIIEGDELVILDPEAAERQVLEPGRRFPLDFRAPIVRAARDGVPRWVIGRAAFEEEFPDGARLAPDAVAALAVPLRVADAVIGAVGFPFVRRRPDIDDELLSLAGLVAEIGGQALERAGLYENERRTRETLDRILSIGPGTGVAASVSDVAREICADARATFGVDVAQVWNMDGLHAEVVWRDPPSHVIPPGTTVALDEFPGLREAVREKRIVFVDDVQRHATGTALEHACSHGIHSAVRIPIAAAAGEGRIVTLQWTRVLPPPVVGELALFRRFADQAGLALEQADRRRAERESRLEAEQIERLLATTTGLAAAGTAEEVAAVVLDQSMEYLDADAASLLLVRPEGLVMVDARNYGADVVERFGVLPLELETPPTDAARMGERVIVSSAAERTTRYPHLAGHDFHETSVSVPLCLAEQVLGVLVLAFSNRRVLDARSLELLDALSHQAAQSLDRARLLDAEHAARQRAEATAVTLARLQTLGASLGRALRPADVAEALTDHLAAEVGGLAAAVYALDDREQCLELIASSAPSSVGFVPIVPLEAALPVADTIRDASPLWLDGESDWSPFPDATGWHAAGIQALGAVPMIAGGAPVGAVAVLFAERSPVSIEARRFVEAAARLAADPLQRVRLLEDERSARRAAERANERTRQLQRITAELASAVTPEEVGAAAVRRSLEALRADRAVLYVVRPSFAVAELIAHEGYPDGALEPWSVLGLDSDTPVTDVIRTGQPLLIASTDELVERYPELERDIRGAGYAAALAVPLAVGNSVVGVLVLAFLTARRFPVDDVELLETVGGQCAQALDRAFRYETERTIAETLQQSVLPGELPELDGLIFAARYLPGTAGVEVGGDWFDVIELGDDRVGLVVGDVVGKGVRAAATMGQLRNGLRAFAFDRIRPASVVSRLNRLLETITDTPFATLVFLTIDRGRLVGRYTSAGHPPPLLVSPEGEVSFMEDGRSVPLGVDPELTYPNGVAELRVGSTVVLYTDGLVERRDRPIEEGLELLRNAAASAGDDPEELIDAVLAACLDNSERHDDVAILVARVVPRAQGSLELELPSVRGSLPQLRRELTSWLGGAGASSKELHDILLASWEAAANAVEHAVAPSATSFSVKAEVDSGVVEIEVVDTGRWRPEERRDERGLGLVLIRRLMDDAVVASDEDGTVVRMRRRLEEAGR